MTVNVDEVARFNKLAAIWWDASGPMWPLHKLNDLRVPFVKGVMLKHFGRQSGRNPGSKPGDAPLTGLTVLDIGCGAGLLAEAMAAAGASVTGVDPAGRNIDIARWHCRDQGLQIEYLQGSVEAVAGRQFDVVLNMEVVEHVDNLPTFMDACGHLVADGGMEVVATLNRNPKSWLFAIIGAEYVLRWLPRGTHQWKKFVKPAEMELLLHGAGLSVVKRAGVAINPFTRAYRVSQDTSVNYMMVATAE